jgi:hypothetical protein
MVTTWQPPVCGEVYRDTNLYTSMPSGALFKSNSSYIQRPSTPPESLLLTVLDHSLTLPHAVLFRGYMFGYIDMRHTTTFPFVVVYS